MERAGGAVDGESADFVISESINLVIDHDGSGTEEAYRSGGEEPETDCGGGLWIVGEGAAIQARSGQMVHPGNSGASGGHGVSVCLPHAADACRQESGHRGD